MSQSTIVRFINPWKHKRDQEELRQVQALRNRDGDECRRCRRPMRFDLTRGHDSGPKVEPIVSAPAAGAQPLDNFCLTHRRCIADAADMTREVKERVRRKSEAELFANARSRRRA
jgi:hypothetical protein